MRVDLEAIALDKDPHHISRGDGVSFLEAVAWFAGEPHTRHPACASPLLGEFGQSLAYVLPASKRQQLKQFIPLIPGTADDGLDETRGYLALDWLIRTYLPAWLELAAMSPEAAALHDQARITGFAGIQSTDPVLRKTRGEAATAWDAASAAVWAAGRSWAWSAAEEAAMDAGAEAAGHAACRAARNGTGNAAGIGDIAKTAARYAAQVAAWGAIDAHASQEAAALATARAALAPTVSHLQDSAITLLAAMISN